MSASEKPVREHWSFEYTFILAASGKCRLLLQFCFVYTLENDLLSLKHSSV
jgi:hypothetical protein